MESFLDALVTVCREYGVQTPPGVSYRKFCKDLYKSLLLVAPVASVVSGLPVSIYGWGVFKFVDHRLKVVVSKGAQDSIGALDVRDTRDFLGEFRRLFKHLTGIKKEQLEEAEIKLSVGLEEF
jgi:hypothetical protein